MARPMLDRSFQTREGEKKLCSFDAHRNVHKLQREKKCVVGEDYHEPFFTHPLDVSQSGAKYSLLLLTTTLNDVKIVFVVTFLFFTIKIIFLSHKLRFFP
jgi:hypothetical protein